jgi:predicted alpha/beta hydrolase
MQRLTTALVYGGEFSLAITCDFMNRLLLLVLLLQTATVWAVKPSKIWVATPDVLGQQYQTVALTTPDQVQLVGWLIEPAANVPDRHTTMVVAYGDFGNMSNELYQAQALSAAGYRVYLFDYRGFGHSADFAIDEQRLYYHEFSVDLGTALADARRRFPHNRTGIIAFSMGTIMGSEVAATARCDFFVTEGYVASPQRLVAYQLQSRQKVVSLPAEATAYGQHAPRIRCPWLLIAGTADRHTPLADSVAVARMARRRQRRQVLTFEGGHLQGMPVLSEAAFGDKYVWEVSQFLAGKRA